MKEFRFRLLVEVCEYTEPGSKQFNAEGIGHAPLELEGGGTREADAVVKDRALYPFHSCSDMNVVTVSYQLTKLRNAALTLIEKLAGKAPPEVLEELRQAVYASAELAAPAPMAEGPKSTNGSAEPPAAEGA